MNRRQFSKSTTDGISNDINSFFAGYFKFYTPAARTLKKGIMWGSIGIGKTIMEKFQAAKEAGFDGVEPMSHLDRKEVLAARDATGLLIPSVCGELALEISSF